MPSTPSRRPKPLGGLEGQPGEGTTATPHIFNKKMHAFKRARPQQPRQHHGPNGQPYPACAQHSAYSKPTTRAEATPPETDPSKDNRRPRARSTSPTSSA